MARRIFIVARGNVAVYNSLTQALRREEDVEIIFDRRCESRRSDLGETLRKVFFRRTSAPAPTTRQERRQRARIDEQIRTQGWAVVRDEGADVGPDQGATIQYKKLRSVWSDPRVREIDPIFAVLTEFRGICLDCLAEKVKLSPDEVMQAVRRTHNTALLAFVTRACVVCSAKSLVTYVRDSTRSDPGTLTGRVETGPDDHNATPASDRSPSGARDLHGFDGPDVLPDAEGAMAGTIRHAGAAVHRRHLRHVGMILRLAEVEGSREP